MPNPWTGLINLLGSILAFFYSLWPNYGVAIILLTLLIGAVTFPLTLKQTRSMRAMQFIQPQVKKLQQEFKHDRQELNQKLMALYQENNVNPASGCLPLIVQLPVWFALFSVLRNSGSIPLGSDLFAIIDPVASAINVPDITAAAKWAITVPANLEFLGLNLLLSPSDVFSGGGLGAVLPYGVLIIIVAASSYYQQHQTQKRGKDDPTPQSSQAQGIQTALKIMPLFFAFISFNFLTGLVLYFAVSNMFRIGQQAVIIGLEDRGEPGPGETPNMTSEDADTADERRGPAPNTSKKRNKRRRK